MSPVLGKKAALEWCMKEGLIGSSYVCPKCEKCMELRERTGKIPATVQKIIEKFQAEGNTLNKPRIGRPPTFRDRERRIIVGNVKKNPKISAPKLTTDVKNNFAKPCNPETIRRVLRKTGYHGRNMQRKPCISKVNRKRE
ncbi:hypothetical protein TNCV_1038861 [Trichonephila clavipes]|uniref:Transposase Tc1-like domain-containing protein n=1 Tax=Trichonephila clavipes TaxID=2585209 RepID=A0A8X6VW15_TRICX|nr:hypothetical protein TNCV_1038861 [Trichonephila clavipes]